MRFSHILMFVFAIAFTASCGNASASAINSGQEYCDVGDVVHFEAVSLDIVRYEISTEINHCPVIAYEGGDIILPNLSDEDIGRWRDNQSNDTYTSTKARPHSDRTDTTDFRRARDGLCTEAVA